MDARSYYKGDFHRPSPYQSPESVSPFRSTFASQRSLESPTANGYNSSRTSYHDYPTSIPYGKETDVEVAQETNSRAVINALKSLQEKIGRLELDRVRAEENLKALANEANDYKSILQKEHEFSESTQNAIEVQKRELEEKLHSAEEKCQLLEKQLKYMKDIRQSSDVDHPIRFYPYEQRHYRQPPSIQPPQVVNGYASPQIEKLAELERGQIKLTASQTLAESKIRELEEKLQEERHQRKLLQDRASELQTLASTNKILFDMTSPEYRKPKKKAKKKKRATSPPTRKRATAVNSLPNAHYRLDLGSIPFVVGQSTTKSHALGANIQKVFSLMKAHNPKLCKAATQAHRANQIITGSSSSSNDSDGIYELISQLQDEFGHMGFEHSELVKQIQETTDVKLREDLERELDRLVARMETKGEQIAILKEHERRHRRKNDIQNRRSIKHKGSEVEVVTTIKTKDGTPKSAQREHRASKVESSPSNRNLEIFKKVQKLQGTLRQDDLSWD